MLLRELFMLSSNALPKKTLWYSIPGRITGGDDEDNTECFRFMQDRRVQIMHKRWVSCTIGEDHGKSVSIMRDS